MSRKLPQNLKCTICKKDNLCLARTNNYKVYCEECYNLKFLAGDEVYYKCNYCGKVHIQGTHPHNDDWDYQTRYEKTFIGKLKGVLGLNPPI